MHCRPLAWHAQGDLHIPGDPDLCIPTFSKPPKASAKFPLDGLVCLAMERLFSLTQCCQGAEMWVLLVCFGSLLGLAVQQA